MVFTFSSYGDRHGPSLAPYKWRHFAPVVIVIVANGVDIAHHCHHWWQHGDHCWRHDDHHLRQWWSPSVIIGAIKMAPFCTYGDRHCCQWSRYWSFLSPLARIVLDDGANAYQYHIWKYSISSPILLASLMITVGTNDDRWSSLVPLSSLCTIGAINVRLLFWPSYWN